MPTTIDIANAMARHDRYNQQPERQVSFQSVPTQNTEHLKSVSSMAPGSMRSLLSGGTPGGWTSDHRAETEKYTGWHYIAIHAIYKQMLQATIEAYERRVVIPGTLDKLGIMKGMVNEQADDSMIRLASHDPMFKTLRRPNPKQSCGAFNGERAIQLCLTGRCLIWNVKSTLSKRTVERYVIPTCIAEPRAPNKEIPNGGWRILPEAARFQIESGWFMLAGLQNALGRVIPAEDVQVIQWPHPKFRDDGQSPISAGAVWTDSSEMIDKSRHNHLKQGPSPSVVIGLDGETSEPSMRRAEAAFNTRYGGVDNHGKAMFVSPAKSVDIVSHPPVDMVYELGWEQMRDALLALHGVPMAAAGLASATGREGLYAPLLQFIELSVQPILTMFSDEDSELFNQERDREIAIKYVAKKFNDEQMIETQLATDISAGTITKGEMRTLRGRNLFGDERDDEVAGAAAAPAVDSMGNPIMPGMDTENSDINNAAGGFDANGKPIKPGADVAQGKQESDGKVPKFGEKQSSPASLGKFRKSLDLSWVPEDVSDPRNFVFVVGKEDKGIARDRLAWMKTRWAIRNELMKNLAERDMTGHAKHDSLQASQHALDLLTTAELLTVDATGEHEFILEDQQAEVEDDTAYQVADDVVEAYLLGARNG